MKIRNEQIQALQETEARRKTKGAEGFDALLNNALISEKPNSTLQEAESLGLAEKLRLEALNTANTAATSNVLTSSNMEEEVAASMNSVLSGMDAYSMHLKSSGTPHLKQAYAMLEEMTKTLTGLSQKYPDMAKQNPELASMVNELSVLTTTEQVKMNRGDYFL